MRGRRCVCAQEDTIDDVPRLVSTFQKTGGTVPLAVLVAEVEALQQVPDFTLLDCF